MKAIIVAAGRGRRLGPETAEIPKCMVAVGGRPILHRQLDALVAAGVDDVVIVRGYLGDKIHAPGHPVRFVENPEWASNNILASLMYAAHEMPGGFLFSYSDIVFAAEHVRRLVAMPGDPAADIGLVVDRLWSEAYVGRVHHPIAEAELAHREDHPRGARITRVGKRVVPAEQAAGEFIGLARFSDAGGLALRQIWQEAVAQGLERPFGTAATLRQAYLSDALNALATRDVALTPLMIDGRWREIDTEEDLARAHPVVDTWD
jgi:phosphoenolpyruvate phosphomutase